MLDVGFPRTFRICATLLAALPLCDRAYGGFPVGIYLLVDPAGSSDTAALANLSSNPVLPLFGPEVCTTGMSGSLCVGGIDGIFLSVQWANFQHIQHSMGTYYVSLDPSGQLASVMSDINTIEGTTVGDGFKFQLSIGLKEGDNSAFDVLDMYTAAGGSPSGTPPGVYTTNSVIPNGEESNNCVYSYSVSSGTTTVISNGGTFDASHGFPEQCTLRADAGNVLHCLPQPRMWGNDSYSTTANPIYIKAFIQAVQDLANFVNGVSGYGGAYPHQFQLLKISGIANHDEEVAIPGSAGLGMPVNPAGGYFYCGDNLATNAEEVWTKQIQVTPPYTDAYESGIMESTWLNLVTAAVGVTSTLGSQMYYAIDVVGDTNFPPVHPAHCSNASGTNCLYTSSSNTLISHLTTGEMEYLIEEAIDHSLLSTGNVAIQNQGLQYNRPDHNESDESNYGTIEIPCAMNALMGTGIGYQSGGTTFNTATDKSNYLEEISNGPAYGAEYLELVSGDLSSFITSTAGSFGITFEGISNYGTTQAQNVNMLAQAMASAENVMALNAASSNIYGTYSPVCPLPAIGSVSQTWTYP